MAEWVQVEVACRIARCSKFKIWELGRKGEIKSKVDPKDKRKKLYKRSDVKEIEFGREKSVTELLNDVKKVKKKKDKVKLKKPVKCENCVWNYANTCMFSRCIKKNGWAYQKYRR